MHTFTGLHLGKHAPSLGDTLVALTYGSCSAWQGFLILVASQQTQTVNKHACIKTHRLTR